MAEGGLADGGVPGLFIAACLYMTAWRPAIRGERLAPRHSGAIALDSRVHIIERPL